MTIVIVFPPLLEMTKHGSREGIITHTNTGTNPMYLLRCNRKKRERNSQLGIKQEGKVKGPI